jgi:hypothetical protein
LLQAAAETHQMLKEAFGEKALSQARTFEWFKRVKDGRESVETFWSNIHLQNSGYDYKSA